MMWRVDYAADGHGTWLSKTDETFAEPRMAIKVAQNTFDRWQRCIGFRIVTTSRPSFQMMTEEHLGKIVRDDGSLLIP